MKQVALVLDRLVAAAARISTQARSGIALGVVDSHIVNALEKFSVSYKALCAEDKAIVNEIASTGVRFVSSYANTALDHDTDNHAKSIVNAGKSAFTSRVKSHSYNGIFGRPNSVDENAIKQFVVAFLSEVHSAIQPKR